MAGQSKIANRKSVARCCALFHAEYHVEPHLHIAATFVLNVDSAGYMIAQNNSRAVVRSQADLLTAPTEVTALYSQTSTVSFDGW